MRKTIASLMILVFFGCLAWANTGVKAGDFQLSKDWCVRTVTLTNSAVVGTITVPNFIVSFNIQAKGGDAKWGKAGTTTEAYWTIGQDQCFYDHQSMPLVSAEVLYFKPATSTTMTVEALFNIR